MGASLMRIPPQDGRSAHGPAISGGESAVLQPGATVGVHNVHDKPLVLLILTLEPESDVR